MDRRDLVKLLGISLGGVSLASCVKEPTGPGAPFGLGGVPPVPSGFKFYPIQHSGGVVGGVTVDHFRFDLSVTDLHDAYFGFVDPDGNEGIGMVTWRATGGLPAPSLLTKILYVGDALRAGSIYRTVIGVHNYDSDRSGNLGVIVSFADDSAATGGPKVTKEVYLRRVGGEWRRLLYNGFVTPEGHTLTGVFGDIDVHDNEDILVTAWFQPASDSALLQAQDPTYPDETSPQQGLFHITGGNAATLTLQVRDDQLQATGDGVTALGLIDMHDGGSYAMQAFPSRLKSVRGPGGVAADGESADSGSAYLVSGRVGSGPRGVAPLTAPPSETRNPLFTMLGGPSGDAWFGPRAGPGGATAYLLQETDAQTALYSNGRRLFGVGDVLPPPCSTGCLVGAMVPSGDSANTINAINPPVFGPLGEVYFVLETELDGAVLCASDSQRIWRFQVPIVNDIRVRVPDSLALGHLTESVDSEGNLYVMAVFDDASAAILVGIPQ